jgi:ATP-binding cassette subfamily C protein
LFAFQYDEAAAFMPQKSTDCELRRAVKSCRSALMAAALMSGMANVLMLTGSFFMLQVYDRVLPSRSVPTLVGLAILVAVLFAFLAAIDSTRARIMARVGNYLDGALSGRAYQAGLRISVVNLASGFLPGRDLDQIRSFLQSPGPVAFFDLPWVPFYAALCFLFHPWIGYAVLLGAMLVTVPTLCTEIITRSATRRIQEIGVRRQSLAEASRRNSEIILASGMTSAMTDRWMALNDRFAAEQQRISDVAGGFGAFTKALRLALQSGVLGLGAYLVIQGESTSGIIIASSIIAARALAPIEQTIAHWKHFVAARQSFARLSQNLAMAPPLDERKTALPKPCRSVAVEGVSVTPPRAQRAVISDVSFRLEAGQAVGIIGPSASGKSSLVRALVGVWPATKGQVRIDEGAVEQWTAEMRCRNLGYLPQGVELLAGTVAENICRFEAEPDDEAIVAAARAASVHDMILHLPQGYETEIGENGAALSAGQSQRIALARALYKDPFLVVLDEPNSNLDQEGDAALTRAITSVRERAGIVVVVAHRPSALTAVDQILVLAQGRAQLFGPRDSVLAKVTQLRPDAPMPVRLAGEAR